MSSIHGPPPALLPNILTRQEKANAIRETKELLAQVRTDWTYKPPLGAPHNPHAPPNPPHSPAPTSRTAPTSQTSPKTNGATLYRHNSTASSSTLSRTLSLRSGGLGSWRASEPTAADELAALTAASRASPLGSRRSSAMSPSAFRHALSEYDYESDSTFYDAWATSCSSSGSEGSCSPSPMSADDLDDDDSLDDAPPANGLARSTSYRRRPSTPDAPLPTPSSLKRRALRRRHAARRQSAPYRSRMPDSPPPESQSPGSLWDSPSAIPTPSAKRKSIRAADRALAAENEGFKHWARQRDQWTCADAAGWIPIGESRFSDNKMRPLTKGEGARREIYERCVVGGRELPVPVPLAEMLTACVEGWRRDGEWPPQRTPAEPSITVKKGAKKTTVNGNGSSNGNGNGNGNDGGGGKGGGLFRKVFGIK